MDDIAKTWHHDTLYRGTIPGTVLVMNVGNHLTIRPDQTIRPDVRNFRYSVSVCFLSTSQTILSLSMMVWYLRSDGLIHVYKMTDICRVRVYSSGTDLTLRWVLSNWTGANGLDSSQSSSDVCVIIRWRNCFCIVIVFFCIVMVFAFIALRLKLWWTIYILY